MLRALPRESEETEEVIVFCDSMIILNTGDICLHLKCYSFLCTLSTFFIAHKWASNKKTSELRLYDAIIYKICLVNFFRMAKFAGKRFSWLEQ